MKKFMSFPATLALRSLVNKLHLSSIMCSAPKAFSLLLIIAFGLTQLPIDSPAKAQPKARLIFYDSYIREANPKDIGFGQPTGTPGTGGKCIRKIRDGNTVYAWLFPQTIGPEGATFKIGVAAKANETGSGVNAVISPIGIPVKENNKSFDVSVIAKPGDGIQKKEETFTIVPRPAYESRVVEFAIRCHGGFDVIFRYQVEQ